MGSVHIVSLKPAEWEAYKQLRLQALLKEPQAYLSTYEESRLDPDEKWQKRLQEAMNEESQWLLFAKQDNTLVGMVGAFADKENVIEIIAFYVAKEARGKGVGKQLLEELLYRIEKNRKGRRVLVNASTKQKCCDFVISTRWV